MLGDESRYLGKTSFQCLKSVLNLGIILQIKLCCHHFRCKQPRACRSGRRREENRRPRGQVRAQDGQGRTVSNLWMNSAFACTKDTFSHIRYICLNELKKREELRARLNLCGYLMKMRCVYFPLARKEVDVVVHSFVLLLICFAVQICNLRPPASLNEPSTKIINHWAAFLSFKHRCKI